MWRLAVDPGVAEDSDISGEVMQQGYQRLAGCGWPNVGRHLPGQQKGLAGHSQIGSGEWRRAGVGGTFEHAVQGRAADAENFRRTKFISIAGAEDGANMLLDDVFEGNHADLAMVVGGGRRDRAEDCVEVRGVKDEMGRTLHQTLGGRVELGKIAAPREKPRSFNQVRCKLGNAGARVGSDVFEQVCEQLGDIVAAFAQGRNHDAKSSKVVSQLCGKAVHADQRPEAARGECDHAGSAGAVPAQQTKQGRLDGLR